MKFAACFIWILTSVAFAEAPTLPKPPKVNDPALKIELLATLPDVEACTTVVGAPDGSVYIGNDPRDGRLNTKEPVCWITRLSSTGSDRKRTVFADKLFSPAGSAWHDGWLYIIHDPFMSRFKDTDGDGVADVREDLVTNLGLVPHEGLNDHCVSGFTLGMDGFFYISVGDRGIYQAKSPKDGSTLTMQGGGIIRCRPDGTQLEIFSTGTRNHLSVNLDAEDNAFTRDNTDDGNGWWTRLTHHIEGGYYGYPYDYQSAANFGVTLPSAQTLETVRQHGRSVASVYDRRTSSGKGDAPSAENAPTVIDPRYSGAAFLPAMTDFGGGSPTGGLCYLSDGLPESYRGKHFFSEWGKAGLFVTEVARDGATFKFVKDTKLVEPDKGGEFRPMQISVANDGSLLIADWGYGGWKSPRVAGAVWRLFWPEAKPTPRLKDENKASIEDLIAALGHPDRDQRLRAEEALVKKGEAVVEKLGGLIKDEAVPNMQRVHSVWALKQMLDRASRADAQDIFGRTRFGDHEPLPTHLFHAFQAKDPHVRGQGARAIGQVETAFQFELITPSLRDADPAVRLQVATALGRTFQPWMRLVRAFAAKEADRLGKAIVEALVDTLADSDAWVRFTAQKALERTGDWKTVRDALIRSEKSEVRDHAWLSLGSVYDEKALEFVLEATKDADPTTRARAVASLGRLAYQPKPYDGHWWATQPVKTPPPLPSLAWSGTLTALDALATALSDSDKEVRLIAARSFSHFILGGQRTVVAGKDLTAAAPGAAGPGLDETKPSKTLAALRARLGLETDRPVRRELIDSLGVQKDVGAMEVFTQITLNRTADIDSRRAALEAIVKIGGDLARKTVSELVRADIPDEMAFDVIAAVGQLKVVDGAELLKGRLHATDPAMRVACVKSLAALGAKGNTTPALIEALSDKDAKVAQAAVEGLGATHDKSALPALLAFAGTNKLKKETFKAISNIADESAIPVLLGALAEKDTTIRRDALKALKSMREKSWPLVEERLISGLVPSEFVAEIRDAFRRGAITKWKMIGPFENVWDAVHPPEADAVAAAVSAVATVADRRTPAIDAAGPTVIDRRYSSLLAKQYQNAEGQTVRWREVSADPETGRVNLETVFKTNAMVCAYAYAEIDAPEEADAKLLAGSNDQIAIWLNGNKIHNVDARRNLEADKDEVPAHLIAGRNHLFVKIGNIEDNWEFAIRMPGFENGAFVKTKEPRPDEKQRAFALAKKPDGTWLNPGNVRRGEKLFYDKNGPLAAICATCHAVGALGGQIGPNLSLIGTIYNRADLIASVLEPSKTIALGFENAVVETTSGDTFAGVLRNESPDALTVVGADAQPHTITKTEMKTLTRLPTSFMPQGLTLALKPDEFADLVAYLEKLGRSN